MVDLAATMVAAFVGLLGAVAWWIHPQPSPKQVAEILKRFVAGAVAGFLWYALFNVAPFDVAGNWDSKGILQLFIVGYTSLASLGALIPSQFDARSPEFKTRVRPRHK